MPESDSDSKRLINVEDVGNKVNPEEGGFSGRTPADSSLLGRVFAGARRPGEWSSKAHQTTAGSAQDLQLPMFVNDTKERFPFRGCVRHARRREPRSRSL